MVSHSSLPGKGSFCVLMSRAAERSLSLMCFVLLEADTSAFTRLVLPACSTSLGSFLPCNNSHDGTYLAGADDHEAHVEHRDIVASEEVPNKRKGSWPTVTQNLRTHGRQLQLRPLGAFRNFRRRNWKQESKVVILEGGKSPPSISTSFSCS